MIRRHICNIISYIKLFARLYPENKSLAEPGIEIYLGVCRLERVTHAHCIGFGVDTIAEVKQVLVALTVVVLVDIIQQIGAIECDRQVICHVIAQLE